MCTPPSHVWLQSVVFPHSKHLHQPSNKILKHCKASQFLQHSTDLLDVSRCSAVQLTDHPLGPLAEVEPVDGDGVVKLFGQRLRALLQDASLREDAPPAPPDLRAGAKGTIFVLVWLLLRSVVRHRVEIAVVFWVTISGSHLCCW